MKTRDYTATFVVDQGPKEVFAAINDVRGWWSGEIDGDTDRLGAEFTYRHKDVHRSTQKITEFVPGRKVVWHVTDSYLAFVDDKQEWNGTDVTFELSTKGGKTEVRFTHGGLGECYDRCSDAWSSYIKGSLKDLIIKGKGQPNPKEKSARAGS
jgi:Activator of Hsp90 ATPase homolog 1-like protein